MKTRNQTKRKKSVAGLKKRREIAKLKIKPYGKRAIKKFNKRLMLLLINYRKQGNNFRVLGEMDSSCIEYVCKGILTNKNHTTNYLKKLIPLEKLDFKFVIFEMENNKSKNKARTRIISSKILIIPEKMTPAFHYNSKA